MSKGCPVYCGTSVVCCRLTIQVESISQQKNSEVKSDEDDLQTFNICSHVLFEACQFAKPWNFVSFHMKVFLE